MDNSVPLPMFPLSGVLFPATGIPLHIFEPRYKRLVTDLSSNPPYFGVVLITRGSEVGGGDERASIGTLARISEKVQLANGGWVLLAVGESRIRVRTWLPDDPYPVALVEGIVDDADEQASADVLSSLEQKLRYSLLLKGELSLSNSVSPNTSLSPRSDDALWQMCALAPIPVLDQHKLLCANSAAARCSLLERSLDDAITQYESQLSLE